MTEYEAMQSIVNQAAIKVPTAVIMVLRDVDTGPRTATNTASPRESQRLRHGGQALEKPSLNWNAQDKYVDLLNFEIEVLNFEIEI